MEYKKVISDTLNGLKGSYRPADDPDFYRSVKERAIKMEKEKNIGHRVFTAAAGTAAAVAVVGGSVFGLNYLNEHGGLKEGGSAAYQSETAKVTEPVADTEIQNEPGVYRYEKCTLYVRDYTFDGMKATVHYDVVFDDPSLVDNGKYEFQDYCPYICSSMYDDEPVAELGLPYNNYVVATGDGYVREFPEDRPGTICVTENLTAAMPAESVTVKILEGRFSYVDNIDAWEEYDFTMTRNVPVGYISADVGVNAKPVAEEDRTEYLKMLNIGVNTVELIYTDISPETHSALFENDLQNTLETLHITMKDGSAYDITPTPFTSAYGLNDAAFAFYNIGSDIDPAEVENIWLGETRIYGEEKERETAISVVFGITNTTGEYEFLYYIDGEWQEDLTETRVISEDQELRWNISGTGVHTYEIQVTCTETGRFGTLLRCTVDYDPPEPVKDFHDSFNARIFKELAVPQEQGDLSLIEGIYPPGYELPYEVIEGEPEVTENKETFVMPEVISHGVSRSKYSDDTFSVEILYGDEAWELVKERGETDIDYSLPYDKSVFYYSEPEFLIDYADCEVAALVGGTVEYSGFHMGYGNCVLILDENGHYWLYYHLMLNDVRVNAGDTVSAGDIIGHTGTTGVTDKQEYAMRVG